MKSARFDLLLLALLVALLAIGGLFAIFHPAQNHLVTPPAIDMPAVKTEVNIQTPTVVEPEPISPTDTPPDVNTLSSNEPTADTNSRAMPVAETDAEAKHLALLSADWCGACQRFKREVLPQLREFFSEQQLAFREIDIDQRAEEAKTLFAESERTIPQLVLYEVKDKDPGACSAIKPLKRLVAPHTADEVKAFVQKESEDEPESQAKESESKLQEAKPVATPAMQLRRRWLRRQ